MKRMCKREASGVLHNGAVMSLSGGTDEPSSMRFNFEGAKKRSPAGRYLTKQQTKLGLFSRGRSKAQGTAVSKALGLSDEASKQAAERQHDRFYENEAKKHLRQARMHEKDPSPDPNPRPHPHPHPKTDPNPNPNPKTDTDTDPNQARMHEKDMVDVRVQQQAEHDRRISLGKESKSDAVRQLRANLNPDPSPNPSPNPKPNPNLFPVPHPNPNP